MLEDKNTPAPEPSSRLDELNKLTTIPADALRRALRHDLDSPTPLLLSVEDSRIAVAQAMREAMEKQHVHVYHLHERTGLSHDFIQNMVNGSGDLSNSEPLHKLEMALGVRLSHL